MWLYSRDAQRQVLAALTGIEAEVGASLAPGLEHAVAHARLAWWAEECARAASGAGEHPLTRQLQGLFGGEQRPALAGLRGFVDTATWDLARATFETRRELDAYCERWSAAAVEPFAAFALGRAAAAHLQPFGRALREVELLCTLDTEARAGRVRLVLADLDAARLSAEELAQASWGPPLREFVRARHQQARGQLAQCANALAAADQPPLRALMVWAALACARSRRCAAALPRALPAGDHLAPLDGWRAWRAARRADSGRLVLSPD